MDSKLEAGKRDQNETGHRGQATERARLQDCKSVLIASDVFGVLTALQRGTEPRLELRYLVEAAVEMVQGQPELADQLEQRGRDRLRGHLARFS
jgi:hypothetical protein